MFGNEEEKVFDLEFVGMGCSLFEGDGKGMVGNVLERLKEGQEGGRNSFCVCTFERCDVGSFES